MAFILVNLNCVISVPLAKELNGSLFEDFYHQLGVFGILLNAYGLKSAFPIINLGGNPFGFQCQCESRSDIGVVMVIIKKGSVPPLCCRSDIVRRFQPFHDDDSYHRPGNELVHLFRSTTERRQQANYQPLRRLLRKRKDMEGTSRQEAMEICL